MKMKRLMGWRREVLWGICLLLWIGGYNATAQEKGSARTFSPVLTGAPILSITPDARSASMGEVGLTTTADAHSIFHNISKLAYIDKEWGLSFVYTPWLSEVSRDISLSTLSAYYAWGNTGSVNHAMSASVRYFHIGEAMAFQRETLLPMTIVPYELALDLGYSIALNKHWALGASLRYLRSDYNYSVGEVKGAVNNVLADLSATFQTDISLTEDLKGTLRVAVALNNVGNKMSYDGGRSYLFAPAVMRIGVGGDLDVAPQYRVGLHLEANKLLAPTFNSSDRKARKGYDQMSMWSAMGGSFNDATGGVAEEFKEVAWLVGAEYTYDNRLFVRSGFHYQHPSKGTNSGFTFGLGLIYEWAKVDLSYMLATQANSPLNNTLRLGVGINF